MTILDWWLLHQDSSHARHILKEVVGHGMISSAPLTQDQYDKLETIMARVNKGEPLAYVIGSQPFLDCDIKVTPDVLIPRPATEEAVARLIETLPTTGDFLDMCTGSGCVAIAIKKARPGWRVYAIDASQAALAMAQKNAALNQVSIIGRLWDIRYKPPMDLPKRWDVIFANPPYVSEDDYKRELSLHYEPKSALVPGDNPIVLYHDICRYAKNYLDHNGSLWFEYGHNQKNGIEKIVNSVGLRVKSCYADMQGFDRIMHCTTS